MRRAIRAGPGDEPGAPRSQRGVAMRSRRTAVLEINNLEVVYNKVILVLRGISLTVAD